MINPEVSKGNSPFYPGQPVPLELFVGRSEQIRHIVERGIGQASAGKPIAVFVEGEYGIGKSSIARFLQWLAEKEYGLHAIYASLGGAASLEDLAGIVVHSTIQSGAFSPTRGEALRNWLAKYIGTQSLFGLTVNVEALKQDVSGLSNVFGILQFLTQVHERLKPTGVKGLFLVLDEINGITANPQFSHFLKGLVDQNAMAEHPVPLLLMLCGVEERRREMISHHEPVARIFDVVQIPPMNDDEMREFFAKAFDSVKVKVQPGALQTLSHYSAGFPKVMHTVGDAAFWIDRDGVIDEKDAIPAVLLAADEIGKKYVDQQVYRALQSADYHSILNRIAKMGPDVLRFSKAEVEAGLTDSEKRKFNNFLQKMKDLNVIRSGEIRGEYVFNLRMVRLYIWLRSIKEQTPGRPPSPGTSPAASS